MLIDVYILILKGLFLRQICRKKKFVEVVTYFLQPRQPHVQFFRVFFSPSGEALGTRELLFSLFVNCTRYQGLLTWDSW
jgi:hypothetical protein